jgi:hypothetical protein
MKVEIKRIDSDDAPTYWSVYVDNGRVSDFPTFRKAMNCAKQFEPNISNIILDPIDR